MREDPFANCLIGKINNWRRRLETLGTLILAHSIMINLSGNIFFIISTFFDVNELFEILREETEEERAIRKEKERREKENRNKNENRREETEEERAIRKERERKEREERHKREGRREETEEERKIRKEKERREKDE